MKICILTANLGNFDKRIDPVVQSVPCDFRRFTDENFPPRKASMTPRLQARIVKMFGWQMVPGYEIYIWVDSSCSFQNPDSVRWLVDQCHGDVAVFKHPNRGTVELEANYLKARLAKKCPYITPRYENELIDEQLEAIRSIPDNHLFASTVIVYKNNEKVHKMMKEWWYHTSRFHSIDQLSLPYAIQKTNCEYNIIPDDYTKTPYITYVRNNKSYER
jgi:hypothetical protein